MYTHARSRTRSATSARAQTQRVPPSVRRVVHTLAQLAMLLTGVSLLTAPFKLESLSRQVSDMDKWVTEKMLDMEAKAAAHERSVMTRIALHEATTAHKLAGIEARVEQIQAEHLKQLEALQADLAVVREAATMARVEAQILRALLGE
jgi:hypothetical protein